MVSKSRKTRLKRYVPSLHKGGCDLYRSGGRDRLGTGIKEAKDAEIPVFLLDRSIDVKDKSLYMTTVTADNILEGKLIGDWLVKSEWQTMQRGGAAGHRWGQRRH